MQREPGGDRRVLWLRGTYLMPSAIETIVAVYVEHKNRLALDDMLRHRQRLLRRFEKPIRFRCEPADPERQ